jgi:LCP family protein required for cell wall assembly
MEPYGPPGRARRGKRWLLTAISAILVLLLAAPVMAFLYLQNRLEEVRRVTPQGLVSSGNGKTILLVGSDSRAGLAPGQESFGTEETVSGQRSDAIMVLHADPDRDKASVLSIPRDLWVSIDGTGGSGRINAAYAGGPERLIKTIHSNLGIRIDHYVELNFDGFRGIVDAIGGLNVPFPAPARDILAELDVPTAGCVHLSGRQGLAYVRSRHYELLENGQWKRDATGDHGRIQRQQDFIRRMISKSMSRGIRNPLVANELLGSFIKDVTIDNRLGTLDLVRLGFLFRTLGSGGVEMLTLPTVGARVGRAAVVQPKQPEATQTIERFLNPPLSEPEQRAVLPSEVRVQVLNGSGRPGEAGTAAQNLRLSGFALTGTGDAGSIRSEGSVIRYAPGAENKAAVLQGFVVGGVDLQFDPTIRDSDVVLVTGRSFGGIQAPGSAPPSTPQPPGKLTPAHCPP